MMLARVADSLYWMGRYIERAEHVSRLSDVMLTASLDATGDAPRAARTALGAPEDIDQGKTAVDVALGLILDREDPGSVIVSVARARENARQVQSVRGERVEIFPEIKFRIEHRSVVFPGGDQNFRLAAKEKIVGIFRMKLQGFLRPHQ